METPGTSDGFKNLCVSTNNLQEARENDKGSTGASLMEKDKSRLLNIFPEEIWLKVLGDVDRGSLESVNNASPFFRQLLYPERTLFLFDSVWKVLGVQYEVDSDPVYCDSKLPEGRDLNDARHRYDTALEKPTFSVILKLRLVCREWCLAINKFYEDLYHNYGTQESVLQPRVESGLDSADEIAINRKYGWKKMGAWSQCRLGSVAKVQNFMEHFEATHDSQTNPFPFRKVTFTLWDRDIHFLTEATRLVKKYGHQIWFCELSMEILGYGQDMNSELYLKFREMLTLMPNLKVLRFSLAPDYFNRTVLGKVLATHPFPRLENLTFVSFKHTAGTLMENLLENNGQVTKLEILQVNDFNFATIASPNLTHLSVSFESVREFEMFENCGRLWRLEMLHVTFGAWQGVSFNPLRRFFACLEQWKDSLEDVVVSLPYAHRDEDEAEIVRHFGIRLDLPHVKRLKVIIQNIMSLDFILPMKNSLELLEYSYLDAIWGSALKGLLDEMKTQEVIKFRSVQNGDMYNSNIWTLFPKLRRIHVEKGYEVVAFIRQKVETSEGH